MLYVCCMYVCMYVCMYFWILVYKISYISCRMVQRCPLAFLSSPIANTALNCGLASSLHMHRDAFSSVMKFFKDIIQCPIDNSLVS